MTPVPTTRWGAVAVLLAAAVATALQIGKAAIALPDLQRELSLSLFVASWIIGAYGVAGTFLGLPAGILSSLVTAKRATVAGLLAAGLGSLAGAFASDGTLLLVTRLVEGAGFLAASLSIPRLLRLVTAPDRLTTVMPLFSSFLPTGSMLMMFSGPALLTLGWPALWVVNGVICLVMAVAVAAIRFDEETTAGPVLDALWPNLRAATAGSGPLVLSLAFGAYTFQYMALSGLLPTLLVDRNGLSIAAAGMIGGIAVLANAAGNMLAGPVQRMGAPTWAIVTGAFAVMGLSAGLAFWPGLPVVVVAALATLSLGVTGLVPGSIHSAAAKLASSSAMLAIMLGLVNQITSLGNLAGPIMVAAAVERYGWDSAGFAFAGVALVGVVLGLALRRVA